LADRKAHQFELCREAIEKQLQRGGAPSIDPSFCASLLLIGILYGNHQRAEAGEETAHAPGMALVHRSGLRSEIPHHSRLEKPARTVSGIELFEELF